MKLRHTLISIPAGGVWLDGQLAHAPDVRGLALVLLSDSWHQPALQSGELETVLQEHGLATMTLNLLTRQEAARDPDARFHVPRLTERVLAAADWIQHQPPLAALGLGLVTADTAAAAAVRAAVQAPARFDAIACLGGRPDLAGAQPLRALRTPIRFIVAATEGGAEILQRAYALIGAPRDWVKLAAGAAAAPAHGRGAPAAAWLLDKLPAAGTNGRADAAPAH